MVDTTATHLPKFKFKEDDLLIMGPEKEGLPEATTALCDQLVYIPGTGKTDCLNVSVSLGVFLYAASLNF